ncbi:MAG: helix-turn-helix domain-containing protein [Bryobacterales bacterium]|nr:helix-turn-helix domain-containing protein [Bryobacterales bacterium]
MASIGEQLRRQRLQGGIDLEQIARETKINSRLLEAIEADDFDKLPGGVFRKSFIRQYAHALGLDENDIAAELDQLEPPEEPPELQVREEARLHPDMPALPTQEDALNRRWLAASAGSFLSVLGVIVACALIYSWWSNLKRPPTVTETPPAASAPMQSASDATPPVQHAVSDTGQSAQEPVSGGEQQAAAPQPAVETGAAPVPQPQPAAYTPAASGMFRVDLSASEPVWISATVDGKRVFMGNLDVDRGKTFEGAGRIRIRTGNAGGLGVSLNGKSIGEIGPKGQIREIDLTPQGAEIIKPAPPPDPDEPVEPPRGAPRMTAPSVKLTPAAKPDAGPAPVVKPIPPAKPVEEIPETF